MPFETYHKSGIGAASPLAAGLLGYYITKKFGDKGLQLAMKGKPKAVQKQVYEGYQNLDKNNVAKLVGLSLAAGETARKASTKNEGLNRMMGDLIYRRPSTNVYGDNLEPAGLSKVSADIGEVNFDEQIIPVKDMMGVVNNDRFLKNWEKLKTNSIMYNSDKDKEGIVSGRDISETAVRAGIGFVPSYALGKTMAKFAGYPKETLGRMGVMGGIAGALYNTGVFGE